MPYRYEDPVEDAIAYEEDRERRYVEVDQKRICQHCGRPCGAEDHFNLWGDVVACSVKCALKLLDDDDLDEIATDWIYTQKETPEEVENDERW